MKAWSPATPASARRTAPTKSAKAQQGPAARSRRTFPDRLLVRLCRALALALTLLVFSPPAAGAEQVPRYALEVHFDPVARTLAGAVTVDLPASLAGEQEVHFVLGANNGASPNPHLSRLSVHTQGTWGFSPSSTTIQQVRWGGAPVPWRLLKGPAIFQTWSLEDHILVVQRPQGGGGPLTVEFTTRVPLAAGDQGLRSDTLLWRFGWFPQLRPRQGQSWSDEARLTPLTGTLTLTAPERWRLLSSAARCAEEAGGEGQTRHRCELGRVVRSVPLVLSRELKVAQVRVGEVDVSLGYFRDGW